MCVAIAQEKGSRSLTYRELELGWQKNPDGGGFAYIDEHGSIQQYHSMEFDEFAATYIALHDVYGATSPFLVHMRIATTGSVCLANTHPFTVELEGDGESVMIHNGMISGYKKNALDETDTYQFVKEYLQALPDNWVDNSGIVQLIEDRIGYSKLAILTTSPLTSDSLYVINSKLGYTKDGIFFSNESCEEPKWNTWVKTTTQAALMCDTNAWWDKYNDDVIDDEVEFFYPKSMIVAAQSDIQKLVDMEVNALDSCACTICFGMDDCYCDYLCHKCWSSWYTCECKGKMVTIAEYWETKDDDDIDEHEYTVGMLLDW